MLIDELRASLDDIPTARRLLVHLGRYYDPVLGGPIMGIGDQKAIVAALEAGQPEQARSLIEARYQLYIKDRLHLGRRDGADEPTG